MNSLDIVGFGALNWDRLLQVDSLSRDDEHVVRKEASAPGGSAANTVYSLAKLGLSCAFIGAVGMDLAGRDMRADLESVGIDTGWVATKRSSSGEALCLADHAGHRFIALEPNSNARLVSRDLRKAMKSLRQLPPDILHLSSFVGDQLDLQVRLADELASQSLVTCAPGAIYARQGRRSLMPLLESCAYLFFNRHEITQLTRIPEQDFERAAGTLRMALPNCRAVIVTLGDGYYPPPLPTPGVQQLSLVSDSLDTNAPVASAFVDSRDSEPFYLDRRDGAVVVDGTGAGDAFTAGMLFGIHQGWTLRRAAEMGQSVAERCLTGLGARVGLPSTDDLVGLIPLDVETEPGRERSAV